MSESLDSALSKLSASSGVNLRLSEELKKAALKVTSYLKDLELGKIMDGLAELFHAEWVTDGQGYVLASIKPDDIARDLIRLGDPGWFDYCFGRAQYEKQKQVAQEIYEALTDEQRAQAARKGVTFASLPAALQNKLTEIAQGMKSWDALVKLRKAMPDVLARAIFLVRIPQKPDRWGEYVPEISVTVVGGNTVARIPWVRGPKPTNAQHR